MDLNNPDSNVGTPVVGAQIPGTGKDHHRRALLYFPCGTDAPYSGVAPPPGATITGADVTIEIDILDGATGFATRCHPCTRDNWAGNTVTEPGWYTTWNSYRMSGPTKLLWTTAGGDYDAGVQADFTSPAALGPFTFSVLALYNALAPGANLNMLIKAVDELPATTRDFGTNYNGSVGTPPELVITYVTVELATVDDRDPARLTGERARAPYSPAGGARAAQPARPARPRR